MRRAAIKAAFCLRTDSVLSTGLGRRWTLTKLRPASREYGSASQGVSAPSAPQRHHTPPSEPATPTPATGGTVRHRPGRPSRRTGHPVASKGQKHVVIRLALDVVGGDFRRGKADARICSDIEKGERGRRGRSRWSGQDGQLYVFRRRKRGRDGGGRQGEASSHPFQALYSSLC